MVYDDIWFVVDLRILICHSSNMFKYYCECWTSWSSWNEFENIFHARKTTMQAVHPTMFDDICIWISHTCGVPAKGFSFCIIYPPCGSLWFCDSRSISNCFYQLCVSKESFEAALEDLHQSARSQCGWEATLLQPWHQPTFVGFQGSTRRHSCERGGQRCGAKLDATNLHCLAKSCEASHGGCQGALGVARLGMIDDGGRCGCGI